MNYSRNSCFRLDLLASVQWSCYNTDTISNRDEVPEIINNIHSAGKRILFSSSHPYRIIPTPSLLSSSNVVSLLNSYFLNHFPLLVIPMIMSPLVVWITFYFQNSTDNFYDYFTSIKEVFESLEFLPLEVINLEREIDNCSSKEQCLE